MRFIIIILFFIYSEMVFSQDTLTLEQCIDFAVKNKKNYIQENYDINKSALAQKFHKFSILPSLSANTGYYLNFGRKLDAFTNTFATSMVQSQNMGLSSNVMLFGGNKYFDQKKINTLSFQKSTIKLETKIELVKLSVIQKYIDLLKIQYKIENQKLTIEKLKKFIKQQALLLKNGRLNKIDTLQTSIQEKTALGEISRLKQDYRLKLFALNFDCGFPLNREFQVKVLITICENCKVKMNEIKELELLGIDHQSELVSSKMAQNSVLPTVSLGGNLSTGYSTNNKDFSIPGTPVKPYGDQINANIYESVGLNLSIPIYNRGEYFKNKQNAKYISDYYSKQKELKEYELALKKLEIEQKIKAAQENILLTEEILAQKLTIYKLIEVTYFEGKISIIDLEKAYNEMEILKNNLVDLRLEVLLNSVYEL
jgi:outer membrane protein